MVRSPGSSSDTNSSSTAHMPLPEFAKYIPMRLSLEERSLLNVLEQTLHVSEYTDDVDVTSSRRGLKVRRILDGIVEVFHVATGLAVASGHERSLLPAQTWKQSEAASATFSPTNNLFRKKKHGKMKKKRKGKNGCQNGDDRSDKNGDGEDTPNTSSNPLSSVWASRDPRDNAVLFQTMFEVGRRNKVLNPNQMRTTYGKLMVSSAVTTPSDEDFGFYASI